MKKLAAVLLCAALALPSLAGAETVKIKVGASPTPHAELLKVANEGTGRQLFPAQALS